MDKTTAKKIAEEVTNEQLYEMFWKAKNSITDWTIRSTVNKSISKGGAWNILAHTFDVNTDYHILAKINMVREFGEYLPDEVLDNIPIKKKKPVPALKHIEPDFSNWASN